NRIRIHLAEFFSEGLHCGPAAREAVTPRLHFHFVEKPWSTLFKERFEVVRFAPVPVILVRPVGRSAKIPLFGWCGEERAVRRADTEDDFCHKRPLYCRCNFGVPMAAACTFNRRWAKPLDPIAVACQLGDARVEAIAEVDDLAGVPRDVRRRLLEK